MARDTPGLDALRTRQRQGDPHTMRLAARNKTAKGNGLRPSIPQNVSPASVSFLRPPGMVAPGLMKGVKQTVKLVDRVTGTSKLASDAAWSVTHPIDRLTGKGRAKNGQMIFPGGGMRPLPVFKTVDPGFDIVPARVGESYVNLGGGLNEFRPTPGEHGHAAYNIIEPGIRDEPLGSLRVREQPHETYIESSGTRYGVKIPSIVQKQLLRYAFGPEKPVRTLAINPRYARLIEMHNRLEPDFPITNEARGYVVPPTRGGRAMGNSQSPEYLAWLRANGGDPRQALYDRMAQEQGAQPAAAIPEAPPQIDMSELRRNVQLLHEQIARNRAAPAMQETREQFIARTQGGQERSTFHQQGEPPLDRGVSESRREIAAMGGTVPANASPMDIYRILNQLRRQRSGR